MEFGKEKCPPSKSSTERYGSPSYYTGTRHYSKSSTKKQEKSEDLLKIWHDAFDAMAGNEDYILPEQVPTLLRSVGFTLEEYEFSHYTLEEKIFFEDFYEIVMEKQKQTTYEKRLKDAFRAFDLDKCGYISAEVLRHVLCYLGDKMRDKDVDTIFELFEIEEDDDEVDYDDIIYMMGQRPKYTESVV